VSITVRPAGLVSSKKTFRLVPPLKFCGSNGFFERLNVIEKIKKGGEPVNVF
jgi:hypothetical protein